jgi:hypothetical protein
MTTATHRWKVNHALEVAQQHSRSWGHAGGLCSRSSDQHVVRLHVAHAQPCYVAHIHRLRGESASHWHQPIQLVSTW